MCLTTFMCDILWLFGNLHLCYDYDTSPTARLAFKSLHCCSGLEVYCLLLGWQALLQIEFLQHQGPCRYRCICYRQSAGTSSVLMEGHQKPARRCTELRFLLLLNTGPSGQKRRPRVHWPQKTQKPKDGLGKSWGSICCKQIRPWFPLFLVPSNSVFLFIQKHNNNERRCFEKSLFKMQRCISK